MRVCTSQNIISMAVDAPCAQVVSVDDEQPVKHSVRSVLVPARYQVISDEG